MKFKLFRPQFNESLKSACKREIIKQGLIIRSSTDKILKKLFELESIIKKQGLPDNLVLKQLPDPMGWGIFLHPKAKPIKKGELIGSYGGEVYVLPQNVSDDSAYAFVPLEDMHLTKQEQSVLDKERRFHPSRKYIVCIDAKDKGNFLRFINHSEKPNIQARLMKVKKNNYGLDETPIEVLYFAKTTIKPGSQLLVSYEEGEESYWSVLNIKPEPIVADSFTLDDNLNLLDHRHKGSFS